jgi:hypothetical protein
MLVTQGKACYSLDVLRIQHALHLRKLAGLLGFAHGFGYAAADSSRSKQQHEIKMLAAKWRGRGRC